MVNDEAQMYSKTKARANEIVGERTAIENKEDITHMLAGADLVFITAGMGGGTGTGAAPIVAEIAKEMGILTIGIVTKPFAFEGKARKLRAEKGIERLKNNYGYPCKSDRNYKVIYIEAFGDKLNFAGVKYQYRIDVDRKDNKIYLCIYNKYSKLAFEKNILVV